jgi:hypothetical protein
MITSNLGYLGQPLKNLPPVHRYGAQDFICTIKAGLEDCGHYVSIDDQDFFAAPTVNLIWEYFNDEIISSLRAFKQKAGDGLIFGIISGEDLSDPLIMSEEYRWRRDAYMEAIELADFVWTIVPNVEDYQDYTDASKVFWFEPGYSDRLRNIERAKQCDIDVFMPGHLYPNREKTIEALKAEGLKVRSSNYQLPYYVYQGIAGRSKVILDVAREKGLRFLSSTRILLGINNGITVVSENFDKTIYNYLYDYTVSASSEDLVEICKQTVHKPTVLELGRSFSERFQVDHPRQKNVSRILEDPEFLKMIT